MSGCPSPSVTRAPSTPAMPPRIDPAVVDALNATGRARVLITLHDPAGGQVSDVEREARVAAAQDAVLAQLPATELTLLHRYRNVAGLAALITGRALEVLRADPRVRSIELDGAGGVHR